MLLLLLYALSISIEHKNVNFPPHVVVWKKIIVPIWPAAVGSWLWGIFSYFPNK